MCSSDLHFRAPMAGMRMMDMAFQVVPGSAVDRVWVLMGDDLVWLPSPSLTLNPLKDSNYRYTHECVVTTGYMYAGLYDIYKFYHALKLFTEDLVEDGQVIDVEYQVDNETAWTKVVDTFTSSPIEEVLLLDVLGATGKRMRYRMRLKSDDNTKTPLVKGAVLEAVSRVGVKYSYALPHRTQDGDVDLKGDPDMMMAIDKQDQLDEWAAQLTPLTMRCVRKVYDDRTVFIDPEQTKPIKEKSEGYSARLTVMEI